MSLKGYSLNSLRDMVYGKERRIAKLKKALEEIKVKEWELSGEQTPSYLIAHYALEETK